MKRFKSTAFSRSCSRTCLSLERLESRDAPAHLAVDNASYITNASYVVAFDYKDDAGKTQHYSDSGSDPEQGSGSFISSTAQNLPNHEATAQGQGDYFAWIDRNSLALDSLSKQIFSQRMGDTAFAASGSASGDSTFSLTLAPDVGEKKDDMAIVQYSAEVVPNYKPNGAGSHVTGSGSAKLTVTSKALNLSMDSGAGDSQSGWHSIGVPIGTTFIVTLSSQHSGNLGNFGEYGQIRAESDITLIVKKPQDIAEQYFEWNVNGGVEFGYKVVGTLPSTPRFNLYWGDANGPNYQHLAAQGDLKDISSGTHSQFVSDLTTVPAPGENKLYLVLNKDFPIDEADQTNNQAAIDFDPMIDLGAKYDDETNSPNFGRFFSGVPIADQNYTVELSQSLASLAKSAGQIKVKLGATDLHLQPADLGKGWDHRTYVTLEKTDPGALAKSTDLTVSVLGGTQPWMNAKATIDVVPLPTWMKTLGIKTGTFDSRTQMYSFGGKLFDFNTTKFVASHIPPLVAGWLPTGRNGVNATADLTVKTTLNPTLAPDVSAKAHLHGVYKGKSLFDADPTLANGSVKIDSRTLEFTSATFELPHKSDTKEFKDVFGSTPLIKNTFTQRLQLIPKIDVSVAYTVDGKFVVGPSGPIWSKSSFHFAFNSTLTGTGTTEIKFGTTAATAINVVEKVLTAPVNVAQLFKQGISLLLDWLDIKPKLAVNADIHGSLTMVGDIAFAGNGIIPTVSVKSFKGTLKFAPKVNVVLSWLNFDPVKFQSTYLTDLFTVDNTF